MKRKRYQYPDRGALALSERGQRTYSLRELQRSTHSHESRYLPENPHRPKVRGDCAQVVRPCPWVSCRYNLALDVRRSGSLTINAEPGGAVHSHACCALDEAAHGERSLEEISIMMGVTRERIRQEEAVALKKLHDPDLLAATPEGEEITQTEYTQAPKDEILPSLGFKDEGDIRWLKQNLTEWAISDEGP